MPEAKQNGLQRLADGALYLVPIISLVFGTMWSADWLRLQQCPAGTFLAGTLRSGLQIIGIMAAVMLMAFGFRHWVLHKTPRLRKWLNWKCQHDDEWHKKIAPRMGGVFPGEYHLPRNSGIFT